MTLVVLVLLVLLAVLVEGAGVVVGVTVGVDDVEVGVDTPLTGTLAVGALWQATVRAATGSRPQGFGFLALISRCPLCVSCPEFPRRPPRRRSRQKDQEAQPGNGDHR
ncbi:MAG TPA: hypothetical protein VKB14_14330 [Actinomycetales bacterium]|nr:hypothetical protein [Actinomycetales bacterium]